MSSLIIKKREDSGCRLCVALLAVVLLCPYCLSDGTNKRVLPDRSFWSCIHSLDTEVLFYFENLQYAQLLTASLT